MTAPATAIRRLAFSTLGCPGWTLEGAAEFAVEHSYKGLSLRLLDGELVPPHLEVARRRRVASVLDAYGLRLVSVDTSLRLSPEPDLEQLAAYLELAAEWSAPLVRVFPGPGDHAELVQGLALAASLASAGPVLVGVETHDSHPAATPLAAAVAEAGNPAVGVVWDLLHTHRSGETPAQVLAALAGPPLAVHVKDARRGADAWRQVLLGEGEVPVAESVSALGAAGYRGWLVVEWEKHWHPELEEPEIALAQHAEAMAGVLGQDGKVELNR